MIAASALVYMLLATALKRKAQWLIGKPVIAHLQWCKMLETVLYPEELKHRDFSNQHGQYNQIHPKGREQLLISFLNSNFSIIHQVIPSLGIKKIATACKITVKFVPVIVNRGEWLWNSSKFFVVCYCSAFCPWPCTKDNSCLLHTEEPTCRNMLIT